MDIYDLSYSVFKRQAKQSEKYLAQLSGDLVKAHISITKEKWISLVFFTTTICFIAALVFGFMWAAVMGINAYRILIVFVASLTVSAASGALAYYYPSIVASERKKKIENSIAFATIYMATIVRSGFPPQHMFRALSKFKEYGEISTEAALVSRDMDIFGVDMPTALSRAINRSPSQGWADLLGGLKTATAIGGDLGAFLDEKSKGFVADYRRRLQDFSNVLSILIEVYITLVIVGAVFFIVTTSIMVAIGGISTTTVKTISYTMVLVGIPVLTAAFILIIKGVSPLDE